ncbi:MAG: transposase family protein, partial [Holosporales bacterium]|nr:transposase family protein [Holosporales bacterium]
MKIDDTRSWKNQVHDFISIIGTTFCAALAGIDSFSGISDFVEMHFSELSKYFDLSGGVPSHDTYQRFWNAISPLQFSDCFAEFVESLQKIYTEIISLD